MNALAAVFVAIALAAGCAPRPRIELEADAQRRVWEAYESCRTWRTGIYPGKISPDGRQVTWVGSAWPLIHELSPLQRCNARADRQHRIVTSKPRVAGWRRRQAVMSMKLARSLVLLGFLAVPTHYFRIVLRQDGNQLIALAFLLPHWKTGRPPGLKKPPDKVLGDHLVPIKGIRERVGMDLLPNLDAATKQQFGKHGRVGAVAEKLTQQDRRPEMKHVGRSARLA